MTKNLIISSLLSLILISCLNKNEVNDEQVVDYAYKMPEKRYMEFNGKLNVGSSSRRTYLDSYYGNGTPEGKEVTYDDLSPKERQEFDAYFERIKSTEGTNSTLKAVKIYQKTNGRKTIATIVDFSKIKIDRKPAKRLEDGSYSILQVNIRPIFPGCEPQDSSCFFSKLDDHFDENFNTDIAKKVGLSKGRNKINVSFNINTIGKVSDIEVKTTHQEIEMEVTRVLKKLPKMTVGKIDRKPVKVKYTLPFVFYID